MHAIEIKDLTYFYPGTEEPALNHINLEINKGDFVALVGNNGCGKSTLCKVINGLIPHFISGRFEGRVLSNQVNTLESNLGELAKEVGYVYQDFENQVVRPTVLDDASYACLNFGMADYLNRGLKALKQCNISHLAEEYIWQLSGGQTHLVALSSTLALEPDILILDEPIAQLDPKNARQIYETLKILNSQYGKTIVVIEHHTEYIAEYCKNVILMKDGEILWQKPTQDALQEIDQLLASNIFPPQVTLAFDALEKEGLIKVEDLPITMEEALDLAKRTAELQLPSTSTKEDRGQEEDRQKKRQKESESNKEIMVEFENVNMTYQAIKGEGKQVFKDLNLKIYQGDKIAIIGSNGAGKSTLMKIIVGLAKIDSGRVLLQGSTIRDVSSEMLSNTLSFVYQNPEQMFIQDTIEKDISFAMEIRQVENWEGKTQALLDRFNLTDIKDRDGRLLSGGQMRRASLAIGVALEPEILMLDEPTANLDIATRKEIMRTLGDLKEVTETVLIATHDMQLVAEWADRILVLHKGELVADGSVDEIFSNDRVLDEVGIRPPEIYTLGQGIDPNMQVYSIDQFMDEIKKRKEKENGK